MDGELRYRFIAEWFDPSVKVKRSFLLTYFPTDGSVEMYDRQLKRLFLKRIKCSNVNFSDMYVGSVVNIFSRQLFIVDFADDKTKEKFTTESETTLCIVKSGGYQYLGTILDTLSENNLTISKGRLTRLTGNMYLSSKFILSESFAVFEIRGEDAVDILKQLLGHETVMTKTLRKELGSPKLHCLCPLSEADAKRELEIFFPSPKELHCNTAVFKNSSCCIIKPHIVRDGLTGKVIQHIIDAGFEITALEIVNFDLPMATEFYEVYKGVLPFFQDMVAQLISGPCVALEVTKSGVQNVVMAFREVSGPIDSELAKKLRSNTIRACFGNDQVKNAVHCTDLPDDGRLEVEYLFRILPLA